MTAFICTPLLLNIIFTVAGSHTLILLDIESVFVYLKLQHPPAAVGKLDNTAVQRISISRQQFRFIHTPVYHHLLLHVLLTGWELSLLKLLTEHLVLKPKTGNYTVLLDARHLNR